MNSVTEITICPTCDLVQNVAGLEANETLHCARCKEEIVVNTFDQHFVVWAMLITAGILVLLMNTFPLVELKVNGVSNSTTLPGAINALFQHDMNLLATLVLATTIAIPSIEIILLGFIFVPSKIHGIKVQGNKLIYFVHTLRSWSMVEVFLLGAIVAFVKLAALAEIVLGPAIWACGALIIVLAALNRLIRAEQLWMCIQEAHQ